MVKVANTNLISNLSSKKVNNYFNLIISLKGKIRGNKVGVFGKSLATEVVSSEKLG
jgi:hypothetical protein